jgi:phenylpropionate dioxygenase-like ring-hydroxylating dioxygenase large terminal subunit
MTTVYPTAGQSPSVDPASLVQRGPGTFRVHTDAYTDPRIFELEMERIWSRTWVYVGHESEIPEPGNYKTSHIGRAPIIVSRGDDGGINVFYNRCRHRGSVVCREPRGFANSCRCPSHGWIYGKDGRLLGVSMRDGYAKDFDQPDGLLPVAKVESYKGLIFASASDDVPDLKEQLGLAATWIDRRVGMSPVGEIELVSDPYVVEYKGNWKFQIENIIDEYHFAFVHEPFMKLQEKYGDRTGDYGAHVSGSVENMNQRRQAGRRSWGGVGGHGLGERQVSDDKLDELLGGEDSEYYKTLLDQHGRDELSRMVGGGSVMTHPNLGLIHRQIRVIRPLSVDRTEVTIYPYEVKGAPASHNEGWLRSQERFYGPAGYGMPDDVEMFALNQQGLAAKAVEWLILERGLDREEVNEHGDKSAPVGGETPLRALWEEWLNLMTRDA